MQANRLLKEFKDLDRPTLRKIRSGANSLNKMAEGKFFKDITSDIYVVADKLIRKF